MIQVRFDVIVRTALSICSVWMVTAAIASGEDCKFAAFAIEPARNEVKERLKAPATAKFSPAAETKVTCEGELYAVRGWVDSQNEFGALIRNRYEVKLQRHENTTLDGKHDPKDDLWMLVSVDFTSW